MSITYSKMYFHAIVYNPLNKTFMAHERSESIKRRVLKKNTNSNYGSKIRRSNNNSKTRKPNYNEKNSTKQNKKPTKRITHDKKNLFERYKERHKENYEGYYF
ncbi:ORfan [Bandra megavirus]|uniref:ORfan n=1 Tax=Bandra megavirus TaxID=2071566 RepID=A0A2K9V7Z9_9VIRU|nr:ORfan [Bandra megavirus]